MNEKAETQELKGPSPERHLPWAGSYNTRDLGGLPTVDGRVTRWRSLIRSDNLGRLTAEGRQALLDYGVRTVIDLRSPREAAKNPSAFSNDNDHGLVYLNKPAEKHLPHVSALIKEATSRGEVYCIVLDHHQDATAAFMRAIIEAQPGGIVIHCHAGKDRTGINAALLLGLAGVPDELIIADYAESQERLRPYYERTGSATEDDDDGDFWSRPTATADMMAMMLEHLERQYGGVEGYLRAAGLSPEELNKLRSRLR